jgi:hypothetical protein
MSDIKIRSIILHNNMHLLLLQKTSSASIHVQYSVIFLEKDITHSPLIQQMYSINKHHTMQAYFVTIAPHTL